ncbi:gliding motility lipoprotein GldB [Flagellimonas halotolerans]|uniref:Gliding motility lipoprotein GldB n=1 Tax=Flagellimonas halotolerans TaxID=3112164 RepID=A0ABU6IQG3_9FLAO|nr:MULTISPECIES: gliding motility lipoprotein GldB [unclassified Allomuricauda]MEC3965445.1 gliding motility lipoprotein GldB [Muricauda sp. SYSU M86414]MEC4265311.1 gliding motility lipoprotein GldB [Muricauda sp. SYSU M84420]
MKRLLKYFAIPVFGSFVLVMVLLFSSCGETDKTEEEIDKVAIDLRISRFDQEFAKATANDIPKLKAEYPYLFPEQFPDSVWAAKLTDTLQVELSNEVAKTFGNFEQESKDLESLFKHIEYYFPETETPHVVTLTSDVSYDSRVILADSLLLIGLDNYLGEDHHFYEGIQRYIAASLDKKFLTSDVASAFSKKVLAYPRNRTLLSRMVYYGKELYLKDKLIPLATDAQKIGYSEKEMEWAKANEEQMWKYFVERELLYSTDTELDRKFLDPAPFTKFGLELDNESPPRLGRYMGWQIVRAFMEKTDTDVKQMLNLPADEILKESNYKPKR